MPAIPGDDRDVLALQRAAKSLKARGLTDARITNYVTQALALPPLQLPRVFTPTHATGGLQGFPAVDLFAPPGTAVLAPEDCEMVYRHLIEWNRARAVGGWTFYLQATNATYFDTHLDNAMPEGRYRKGSVLGFVADVPGDWWPSHVHHAKHRGRYEV